uniref:Uncharacterized protein n=1 Tax=Amphimedon queenslandica TaxID=400682 RepID=A0A1X7UIX7_AMPQE
MECLADYRSRIQTKPFVSRRVWSEQMRQQQKVLKKTGRELERDRGQLERQEKQLEAEMKKRKLQKEETNTFNFE